MTELKTGSRIILENGDNITIEKELGQGGQGIVYLVDYRGKKMALKWYTQKDSDKFYSNLKNNIKNGAPSEDFLWPMFLTRKQKNSYGYVMKLRPDNYYELGSILLGKANFSSIGAMIKAALNITNGFYNLHLKGYSYQDLNDGNFFINTQTGDVLIADNDNVAPQGKNTGILGKTRYMAPEIITREKAPDKYSDFYSLSVILFLLFYGNHPLEGKAVVNRPCLTESIEKQVYGIDPLFIYDRNNTNNTPVSGLHDNVIKRWNVFPDKLNNAFIDAFSQEKLKNPEKRIIVSQWKKLFQNLQNSIIICDNCGNESLGSTKDNSSTCIHCGTPINIKVRLITNETGVINLTYKKDIHLKSDQQPIGTVMRNAKNHNVLGIKNITDTDWYVETTNGEVIVIEKGKVAPAIKGVKINFGKERGEIV